MAKLSIDQIRDYAYRYMLWALDQADEERLSSGGKVSSESIEDAQEGWSVYQDRWIDRFEDQDWDTALPLVQEFSEAEGLVLDMDQASLRKLCRAIMRAEIERCNIERAREQGDYTDPYAAHVAARPEAVQLSIGPAVEAPLEGDAAKGLAEIVDAYIATHQRDWKGSTENGGTGKGGTEKDVVPILRLLVEVVGDVPIGRLTKAHVREFDKVVRALPARRTVLKPYKDKTLAQLLAMDIPPEKRLKENTVKQYFTYAKSLLTWASRNYDGVPPYLGELLKATVSTDPEQQRNPFTQTDLEAIFYSPDYTESGFKQDWKFWLPLIGLHSGMRLEEICQLHLADIRQEEEGGLWCFDINREQEKALKNKASKRIIPMHPALVVDLDLPGYAEKLRQSGEVRLFPDLNNTTQGKYSHYPSRWFGTYRKKVGIPDGQKKSFHSFRHNFAEACRGQEILTEHWESYLGHDVQVTNQTTRYGGHFPPRLLWERVVSRLKFDLDLSRIKRP